MDNEKKHHFLKAFLIALLIMAVLLVGWQFIFPILGIAVAITAIAWGVLLATIIILAIGTLLFYIFSGIGIYVICVLGLIWVIGALIFFPFLFPILIPLLIILFFIGFVRRSENK